MITMGFFVEVNVPYRARYITTSRQDRIWTVSFNPEGTKTPILMVHGFGAGLGMWALNVKELSRDRPMHTFDMLGFGRSSRPTFDSDPEVVEETFVNSIEDTRKELGLEKFILIGHSFGGYLAYAYTIKHPEQVKSLILADPWGFSEKPADWDTKYEIPRWIRVVATIMRPFNPLSGLRIAGPLGISCVIFGFLFAHSFTRCHWNIPFPMRRKSENYLFFLLGPSVMRRVRPDLQVKFSSLFDDDTILNYFYHCNAQKPRFVRLLIASPVGC